MREQLDLTGIRFLYLKDPRLPAHVLTLGWKVVEGGIFATYAMNRVTHTQKKLVYRGARGWTTHEELKVHDVFSKALAHVHIAKRLEIGRHAFHIPVAEGQRHMEALLAFFVTPLPCTYAEGVERGLPWIPRVVRRVASTATKVAQHLES